METYVLFDLDDTLLNNFCSFKQAVETVLNLTYSEEEMKKRYCLFRKSSDKLFKINEQLKGSHFLELSRWEYAFKKEKLSDHELDKLDQKYHLYQSMLSLEKRTFNKLSYLKQNGATMGIITNGFTQKQFAKIEQLKLTTILNTKHIFISESLGVAKPTIEIFEKVSEQLNIQNQKVYYIGDNYHNDISPLIETEWTPIWVNYFAENIMTDEIEVSNINQALDYLIQIISE